MKKEENLLAKLDKQEDEKDKFHKRIIEISLPEQCKSCSFLVITNIRKHKVHCPYYIDKCILK